MAVRTIVCLPARHRRLAAPRRRGAAQHEQGVPVRRRLPRAAGPDPAGHAHHQHGAARRGAARRAARPAGAGALRLQLQPGGGLSRIRRACSRGCGAKTCSPSSTSSSRPTPPTTPTSSCRRRRSSNTSTSTAATGTSTCRRTSPAIAPLGEAKPNNEVFRLLAAAMGFEPELFEVSDEELARQALRAGGAAERLPAADAFDGITLERLQANGPVRLNLPADCAPFAEGSFGTPSGKCELYSPREAAAGRDPLPHYIPPHEDPQTRPTWPRSTRCRCSARRTPSFLNSTFVNVDVAAQGGRRADGRDAPDRRRGPRHRRRPDGDASSTTAAASGRRRSSARR